jgi:lycopene beta-cyclase
MKISAKNPALPFDFIFIGLGAANCLLLLRLHDNGLLTGKTIAIVEPDSKSANDRTFCFWATEDDVTNLHVKPLVSNSWDFVEIGGIAKQQINPLRYFHVKGIDLYDQTKGILSVNNVTFFYSPFKENPEVKSTYYEVRLDNVTLYGYKVFDSRPPIFLPPQNNQSHLYQSFYGLKIKLATKTFDPSVMLMMDFNVPQNNFTQFVYVLPFSEDTALIELTRFGTEKLTQQEATPILNEYIDRLGSSYDILEEERGVIPMSSSALKSEDFGTNWINMGARANMIKCSTGYAFNAMAEDAITQMEAIKNNELPKRKMKGKRFAFYDRLLLKILDEKPEFGKVIFETLFKKISIKKVLYFLGEKTSLSEEIIIFSKLPKRVFITSAAKDILQQFYTLPVLALPFLFTIITLFLSLINLQYISWVILGLGFLSVGLSHGALDHLTAKPIINKKQLLGFIIRYLFKAIVLGLVWLFYPDLALLLFIAYSAWHFGQADFKEWHLKQGWQSLCWGTIVLMIILFSHFEELNLILLQIPNLKFVNTFKNLSDNIIWALNILLIVGGIILAVINKSKYILFTLTYLLLCSMLPLLLSFGIYFVGQHSLHGWRHLSLGLNESSSRLWLKSLPFSIGGALIILYFLLLSSSNYVGIFFIILSCLSIPHVFSMHHFYSKLKL